MQLLVFSFFLVLALSTPVKFFRGFKVLDDVSVIPGIIVGNSQTQAQIKGHALINATATGVTVILCPDQCVSAVVQTGGSPCTSQTDALKINNFGAPLINGVTLSGGSMYGLYGAGKGVFSKALSYLRSCEMQSLMLDGFNFPTIPTAAILDIPYQAKRNPSLSSSDVFLSLYETLGEEAVDDAFNSLPHLIRQKSRFSQTSYGDDEEEAKKRNKFPVESCGDRFLHSRFPSDPKDTEIVELNQDSKDKMHNVQKEIIYGGKGFKQGSHGGGVGAAVGTYCKDGLDSSMKGGLGSATLQLESGFYVGTILVNNAFGAIRSESDFIAGCVDENNEIVSPEDVVSSLNQPTYTEIPHTIIGAVITNFPLRKNELQKLAENALHGVTDSVTPSSTQYDGDTFFGISTGALDTRNPSDAKMPSLLELTIAARHSARLAILRSVCCATEDNVETLKIAYQIKPDECQKVWDTFNDLHEHCPIGRVFELLDKK